jgi:hypothetical protein
MWAAFSKYFLEMICNFNNYCPIHFDGYDMTVWVDFSADNQCPPKLKIAIILVIYLN